MRIFLADDQSMVCSALRLLLEHEAGMVIVGEAPDTDQMLAQMAIAQPDIVLLDWELPGLHGSEALAMLHAQLVHVRIIALSSLPEARQIALASGADAFVSKGEPPEQLLNAMYRLQNGQTPLSSGSGDNEQVL
jgi:DNA-binding NarL/FixJ family response regulator